MDGVFVEEVGVVLGLGWEGHDGLWDGDTNHNNTVYLLEISWVKFQRWKGSTAAYMTELN